MLQAKVNHEALLKADASQLKIKPTEHVKFAELRSAQEADVAKWTKKVSKQDSAELAASFDNLAG